ncbi:hypothetical protein HYH03_016795 [Edaphochlamys debaryana]|uniref:Uncharacterized protein n=1 Tax=Edaphochlamys debaryana TaxID=47281 RepID=A0A835XJ42_9CHLO|nr:hypothetical protein HYH03_016795 [Edaphochlamys debaryana]|eukprot:KAG2484379.1 hypothetical protein HYH03_016795 [Edaphochlamys debaryana]
MDPAGTAVAEETEVRLRKALELINTHLKVAVSEGAGLGAEKQALRQEVEALKKQLDAAEKEGAKLNADLNEAVAERSCLINKLNQCREEFEDLESRMDSRPSHGPGQPAPHGPATPQPGPQPPRQSVLGSLTGSIGAFLTGSSASNSIYSNPAEREPAPIGVLAPAIPKVPAAHPPPPPLLALDPYQLLPGADLPIGLTRSDLQFRCHQFSRHLEDLATYLVENCPDATRLAEFARQQAVPHGVSEVIPSDALSSAPAPFLGHMLMVWMRDRGPWADPLRHLGCSFTFGPLPQSGSSGPEAAGERHLWELLRSYAARRWLPVVEAAAKRAAEEEAAAAHSSGGHSALRGAWLEALRKGGQPEGAKLAEALGVASDGVADWLRNFKGIAAVVKSSPWMHGLMLRALHLGLAVRAAHPLLRLKLSTPTVELGRHEWCRPRPLEPDRQEAQRFVEFKPSYAGRVDGASSGGSFFLVSLQPGLAFDAEAVKGLGAGQGQGPAAPAVVQPEEVVAWSWHRRSSSTGKARRRSNASAGGGGPEGPLGDGAKDDHPLIT